MEKIGAHGERVAFAQALLTKKGRREHHRFSFEGPTLLAEAVAAGAPLHVLYATRAAYDAYPLLATIEATGVPVFEVDGRTFRRISDVETPTGVLGVMPFTLESIEALLAPPGSAESPALALVLADINDPGNVGTLLRSAEAFGVGRVVFGNRGAEPFHPKVVRASMGALFRLRLATADPGETQAALRGRTAIGLRAGAAALSPPALREAAALVVGNERHGLGAWEGLCTDFRAIPMTGRAESLNAAIAGSIALYEATKPSPA